MAQATLFVRHEVEDFATWDAVYEGLDSMRKNHGCTYQEVLVDPANAQDVFVIHRFPSLEQAQAYVASTDLHEAMGRAGVVGAPRIEIALGV
jgi:quinol monooxygenase YgiN